MARAIERLKQIQETISPQPIVQSGDIVKETPKELWKPRDRPFDSAPSVKAIIVGAGIAGVSASILIPRKVANLSYKVFERQDAVGGTWAQNRYPGVRCDIPSHSYQLTFAPNTHWSEYYSSGAEIRQYYERLVKEFGVDDHLYLKHEVLSTIWSDDIKQWVVKVQNLTTGDIFTETSDFFISAAGRLNVPKYPKIPGLETVYKGIVAHTAEWTDDLTKKLKGKRVAVIGNGASGQQIFVDILDDTAHIDQYVRSRQWIVSAFNPNLIAPKIGLPGAHVFTDEEKTNFDKDPKAYQEYRRTIEGYFHGRYEGMISGSKENDQIRQKYEEELLARLGGDKSWYNRLVPDFAPGCKRPIPSAGYLDAIRHPKVDYIDSTTITHATETGLVTDDGKERPVDIVIVATGFRNGFLPLFPTIGKNGIDLGKRWAEDGPIGYPETYFGIMAPNFPNYFAVVQANTNGLGGTFPLQTEISATYISKVIRKVQGQGYRAIYPSQEATDDFNEIITAFFDDKVIGDQCDGWWKSGFGKSRPLVSWPGTGHHRFDISRDPRWEDFVFERSEGGKRNRFEYFGNGYTEREKSGGKDSLTSYLKEVGKIDIATLHENWND
ncbi:dimethylaniline monooxygenase, putative [Talaromyces stipitatus ATCC 10500]|uniref:L-ornithine N(5)-monooxygenase n=1 Tax=Talaromyces stipitatus (strain ATCC 10500 / CBS 375.48 / QM 6759 / NRRL 1006) TaxID=441959 RepID=B8MI18_TALSN|nr:dimethylaniline monooxygenase, putative [Talaromyces stipitatus ATCC 10500]EED17180.1 dimethylaniline monooxygenase, putative [Talaromyces stipitatus ATCC 10500]